MSSLFIASTKPKGSFNYSLVKNIEITRAYHLVRTDPILGAGKGRDKFNAKIWSAYNEQKPMDRANRPLTSVDIRA